MGALNDNNLSIDYEKVAQDAGNINQCAVKMDNILNNFSTKMQDLKRKEIIVGKAADALENSYNELKKNFDLYVKTVKDFSTIISNAANAHRENENRQAQDAENLPR